MRCHEFEIRLHELLDRRLEPQWDRLLRAHARTCPNCQDLLRDQQRILDALAGRQATVTPSSGRTAPSPAARMRPRVKLTWSAGFAIACLVLLPLVSRSLPPTLPQGARPTTNQVAESTTAQPATTPSQLGAPELAALSHVSPSAAPQNEFPLWDDWRSLDLGQLLPEAERVRLRSTRWLDRVREVGGSFRPLTNSVSSTFSILKRTWPGTQPRNDSGRDQASLPAKPDQLA